METIQIENRFSKLGNGIARALQVQTILRIIGIPFQRLIDKRGDTHRFLTIQGISILGRDGKIDAEKFFNTFSDTLIKGNYWADAFWKNSTHHYNPNTKKGLWIWPGAQEQCRNWFKGALSAWSKGNLLRSVFLMGASLHTVQDACQPYHSNCVMLEGHQKYETWVDRNKERYAVGQEGLYQVSRDPEGWVIANALFSQPFMSDFKVTSTSCYDQHTRDLLARAQRTTAGFLEFCLKKAIETGSSDPDLNSPLLLDKLLSVN